MTKRKAYLITGIVLLVIAVAFVLFAFNHPEMSFPWGSRVTYLFYGAYLWFLFYFLLAAPIAASTEKTASDISLTKAAVNLFLAVVFFVMEITTDHVDIFTLIRGFVFVGCLHDSIRILINRSKIRQG